jgi:hypothetical protein
VTPRLSLDRASLGCGERRHLPDQVLFPSDRRELALAKKGGEPKWALETA